MILKYIKYKKERVLLIILFLSISISGYTQIRYKFDIPKVCTKLECSSTHKTMMKRYNRGDTIYRQKAWQAFLNYYNGQTYDEDDVCLMINCDNKEQVMLKRFNQGKIIYRKKYFDSYIEKYNNKKKVYDDASEVANMMSNLKEKMEQDSILYQAEKDSLGNRAGAVNKDIEQLGRLLTELKSPSQKLRKIQKNVNNDDWSYLDANNQLKAAIKEIDSIRIAYYAINLDRGTNRIMSISQFLSIQYDLGRYKLTDAGKNNIDTFLMGKINYVKRDSRYDTLHIYCKGYADGVGFVENYASKLMEKISLNKNNLEPATIGFLNKYNTKASSIPKEELNIILSMLRAEAVKEYIKSKYINSRNKNIVIEEVSGLGETTPDNTIKDYNDEDIRRRICTIEVASGVKKNDK